MRRKDFLKIGTMLAAGVPALEAMAKNNIQLPNPDGNGFYLKINPSLNRETPENVAATFLAALKEAG